MATAAPAKPWERARRAPTQTTSTFGTLGSSVSPPTQPTTIPVASSVPAVPPRTKEQNTAAAVVPAAAAATQQQPQTSSLSSSLLGTSTFGGFGRYGYGGGSLFGGSSYGGYGSTFGSSYGGYGGYGGYGSGSYYGGGLGIGGVGPNGGVSHAPTALQSGFKLVHQISEIFGRLSYLLGASFDSIRNSFASLIGLYEGLWPMLTAVQGLALFRFLRVLYDKLRALLDWILGREPKAIENKTEMNNTKAEDFAWDGKMIEDQPSKSGSSDNQPAPLVIRALTAFAILFGVPYALYHGYKYLTGQQPQPTDSFQQQSQHQIVAKAPSSLSSSTTGVSDGNGVGSVSSVFRAKHNFDNPGDGEVGFRAGQAVRVLDPHAVPGQESWGFAEVDGHRGLVPLNYLTTF